jgi:hypothetical protein
MKENAILGSCFESSTINRADNGQEPSTILDSGCVVELGTQNGVPILPFARQLSETGWVLDALRLANSSLLERGMLILGVNPAKASSWIDAPDDLMLAHPEVIRCYYRDIDATLIRENLTR